MPRITVPATSANIGVGYDCLGLALTLYAHFDVERADALVITGCDERYAGPDNLFYVSMCYALRTWGVEPFPIRLHIDTDVPLARGLGSSSTLVVGGIYAAAALTGRDLDRNEAVALACRMEGHPDNVAPAICGGLVCSFTPAGTAPEGCDNELEPEEPRCVCYDVDPSLRFVCAVPPYEVKTTEARRVVPRTVALADAVWQMGRIAGVTRALETGDMDLLAAANDDRLHEPYRRSLIPDYDAVRACVLGAGASTLWISGSGSTMAAVVREKNTDFCPISKGVADALRREFPGFKVHILSCNTTGARVE